MTQLHLASLPDTWHAPQRRCPSSPASRPPAFRQPPPLQSPAHPQYASRVVPHLRGAEQHAAAPHKLGALLDREGDDEGEVVGQRGVRQQAGVLRRHVKRVACGPGTKRGRRVGTTREPARACPWLTNHQPPPLAAHSCPQALVWWQAGQPRRGSHPALLLHAPPITTIPKHTGTHTDQAHESMHPASSPTHETHTHTHTHTHTAQPTNT